jgi:hypothetical protein
MQCSNRAAWALVAVLCAADAVLGNRVRTLLHMRRGRASLPARRSHHRDRSRAGLNHVEIDHGANGEGGENRRDGDFRDD